MTKENHITSKREFKINDKNCEINYENLGKYTFVADILKKIINAPKEYFKVSRDYIDSEDFEQTYILYKEHYKEITDSIFNTENIKCICEKLLNLITEEIDNYLS